MLLFAVAASLPLSTLSTGAGAVSGSEWRAGNIIDDAVFTNSTDMSVNDIQAFLNARVPVCDTWGEKTSEYGGGTRAQYAASRGYSTPFTCLKDYYEVPKTSPSPSEPANNYGGVPIPPGARSAAQIISDAAIKHRISPKALLVKLATESPGPLTSDDWPFEKQYLYAMGAHCPDSGPNGSANCDVNWSGFSLQMDEAASLLRWYLDSMTQSWWQYKKPYQVNNVLWNVVERGCGGSDIYIDSKATAALYTYTPYQPNQAALNNMYGEGDYCSAYGNRNFWRVWYDWFGSPRLVNSNIYLSKGLTSSIADRPAYVGDTVTASYEVTNAASYSTYVGGLGICARLNGQNYDLGFIHHNTLPGQGKMTVSFSKKMTQTGTLELFICSYNESLGGWASATYPYNYSSPSAIRNITLSVLDNPYLTTGITLNPARPGVNESVTATMSIRNAANTAVNIGSLVIAGRDPVGKNVDFGIVDDVTIDANWGTFNYSRNRSFTTPGKHTFYVANWNGVWSTQKPVPLDGTIIKQLTIDVVDNPHIVSGISVSPANPTVGQPVTVTATLKNTGSIPVNIGSLVVAARDPYGKNVDFKIVNDVTVAANGGTYTYSETKPFTSTGTHKLYIANWNGTWSTQKPASIDSSIIRQTNLLIQ